MTMPTEQQLGDYAIECLLLERLRLRDYIRRIERTQNEVCCGISHEKEQSQLADIEHALNVLTEIA